MNNNTTQRHILPYRFILHPLTGQVIAYTNTTPSQMRIISKGEAEHNLAREDLDVHRRMLYEAVLEQYKENQ